MTLPHAFQRLRIGGPGRLIAYSVVVGFVSGFGAVGFFYALEWFTHVCFVQGAGVEVVAPAGERLFDDATPGPYRQWLFFLLPVLGGLVSGLIVYTWAPEAEGHGTDAMIDAFHRKRGVIRARVPFLKAIATIATLGTGGSAGREGPIAQIGAGFGSWIGRKFGLTVRERRALLLAGTAGGLGAIFRSPLGGALTAVEVLYREDFESEALLPSIVSSVTAYAVFSSVFGYDRIFALPEDFAFRNPVELSLYAVLGLVCIPVGILYIKVFYGARDKVFRRIPLPKHVLPMIGGLGIGLLGLLLPGVYGGGWGQIQLALFGQVSLGLMLALAAGKILATSLTIGSGGSGGVFGPTLFIGGMLGGAVGLIGHRFFPDIVTQPGAYVLVGMAAFFAGVANAPLGVLLMVCEMTGGYDLIAPLLLVSTIALLFTRRYSIYEKQVKDKFHSDAHLADRVVNILHTVPVRDVYERHRKVHVLRSDMSLTDIRQMLVDTNTNEFPVRHTDGHLCGILRLSDARPVILDDELDPVLIVADIMAPLVTVSPDDSVYRALRMLRDAGYTEIPVVDPDNQDRILGVLHQEEINEAYQQSMAKVREISGETEESESQKVDPQGLDQLRQPLDRPSDSRN
ncbi:MAG: chloride channel protein [Myxococcota bacterium]